MDSSSRQLALIRQLFDEAERRSIPLWIESGWAIDARLGRITRVHEDVDVAYAEDRADAYLELLGDLGFGEPEPESYGFLSRHGDVLFDSEPCRWMGGEYGFDGFPRGSCLFAKEGRLLGYRVRCLSWEAMYWEFLGYLREVPAAQWRAKDFESLRVIEANLAAGVRDRLRVEAGMPAGTARDADS